MGGNVFKGVAKRLNKADYEQVKAHVVTALRSAFPSGRAQAIAAFAAKEDFGDLDVLLSSDQLMTTENYRALKSLAESEFGALDWFRNGPTTSIDYRRPPVQPHWAFQVDIIRQDVSNFDYGLCYFSFNDLGNLIGRIAHSMGLAHRHDGLYWYFRDGTYLFNEIKLTNDHARALDFFELDTDRYARGFVTLEDVFQYVASSPFFRPEVYLLKNRNHASRMRDRKRKTYREFLLWCEAHPEFQKEALPEDKSVWFERIQSFFPHFETERQELARQLDENRAAKAKFNGELVSELTGLTGKELGRAMQTVRASFANDKELIDFVLESTPAQIKERVLAAVSNN